MTAFDMFHLQSLPHDEKEWSRIQETYGQEDLNTLISHYYPCSKNDIDGLCKQRQIVLLRDRNMKKDQRGER